jgi:hypothetical protein
MPKLLASGRSFLPKTPQIGYCSGGSQQEGAEGNVEWQTGLAYDVSVVSL